MLRLKAFGGRLYEGQKAIALDYKSAAEGTIGACKERPLRALFYTGCTLFGFISYKTMPTEASYVARIVDSSHKLLLCGPERNKVTDGYVQSQLQYWAKGMLRYQQLGLLSVLYFSQHDKNTKSYKTQCKYGNPRWNEFHQRIIDIGFLGRWWRLEFMMTDYDVDFYEIPKEYKHSYERVVDFVKTAFGYTYFNDLISQPCRKNVYVPTAVNENSVES